MNNQSTKFKWDDTEFGFTNQDGVLTLSVGKKPQGIVETINRRITRSDVYLGLGCLLLALIIIKR